MVRGVLQELALYTRLTYDPFIVLEQSLPEGLKPEHFEENEEIKTVDWKMIQDFALELKTEDVHLILGYYLEFVPEVTACTKCSKGEKMHKKFHLYHRDNARLFKDCRNQKNICQQAADAVIAQRRVRVATASRQELLTDRFTELFEIMNDIVTSENIDIWMAGVAWFSCLHNDIDQLIVDYIRTVVENVPKKRYYLFVGPVNTGKTTLAAALLDLCGGRSLNINLPFDRINFELGMAIDQFTVLFEDVKGQGARDNTLPTGQGVSNLDNLRDHLDGSIKVNLERKHVNKKTQIFPPGIVTMNEYYLPKTLLIRFTRVIGFTRKGGLRQALVNTPELSRMRVLHSGVTLLLLLVWFCPTSLFVAELQATVTVWKETLEKHISHTGFASMVMACMNGGNILAEYREERDKESQGTDDSGFYTQTQK
uniref:DNA 3'-5' helicase n=1 Tax=Lemniscomys rat polyomavirus TaxID=3141921 RepID=A0AAU7E3G4_9POLY